VFFFSIKAITTYCGTNFKDEIMRRNLLFITLFISILSFGTSWVNGQTTELIIEVKTDKYSNENSWKLFDLDGNLIQENKSLESDAYNKDTIQLDNSKCYYWTIYDTYGDGMGGTVNNGAAGYKIYYNGNLFEESTSANFGKEETVYGLGEACANLEVSMRSITTEDILFMGKAEMKAEIVNMGNDEITSVQLLYKINEHTSETAIVENLSISTGSVYEVTHPNAYFFSSGGDYTLTIEVVAVNGENDATTENNVMSKSLTIKNGFFKKPMHEVFTASTCPPCAMANPIIDNIFAQYPGKYSLVKYQMNWPGSGDPYYIESTAARRNLYGIGGVPAMYVNGVSEAPTSYTTELIEAYFEDMTTMWFDIETYALGDSVIVKVDVGSKDVVAEGLSFFAMVLENVTHGNVGTNGEKEFTNVVMKMLGGGSGEELGAMEANQVTAFNYRVNMSETFVEEMNDLSLVAFVQDLSTGEVYQSEMINIPHQDAPPSISYSIANGSDAVGVDSFIIAQSNQALRMINNSEISDLNSIITFKENDINGADVAFSAEIDNAKKSITIKPAEVLKAYTSYYISVNNVESFDDIEVGGNSLSFSTTQALSVGEFSARDVAVYPNPATSYISVSSHYEVNVEVYDLIGKKVKQINNVMNGSKIDISDLKQGIYIVKLLNGEKVNSIKLLKK